MKIRIKNHGPVDQSALQIWDILHAYEQFLCRQSDYTCDFDITIGHDIAVGSDCINVAWYHFPCSQPDTQDFDLLFVDGGQHHLEVCTPTMYDLLMTHDNCYFVCSSYVTKNHPWRNKIVWAPMMYNMMRYLTMPFYPQFFEKKICNQPRSASMIFVNGQNRAHRQYMIDLLFRLSAGVPVQNSYQPEMPDKLKDSFFETAEDSAFREFVNQHDHYNRPDGQFSSYYDSAIPIGINKKFGYIPPGYFLIDCYNDYECVIFPETTWLNDEIWPTEKIIKCFISGSIPWPIGGSNTHSLYNELGYQTAWNLLPQSMQAFDQDQNHQRRYTQQAEAISWANQHPEIWQSETAKIIRHQNLQNLMLNNHDGQCAKQLHQILSNLMIQDVKLTNN